MVTECGEKNTFTEFFTTFNVLRKTIRIIDNKKIFDKKSRKYHIDRALARTLSL